MVTQKEFTGLKIMNNDSRQMSPEEARAYLAMLGIGPDCGLNIIYHDEGWWLSVAANFIHLMDIGIIEQVSETENRWGLPVFNFLWSTHPEFKTCTIKQQRFTDDQVAQIRKRCQMR